MEIYRAAQILAIYGCISERKRRTCSAQHEQISSDAKGIKEEYFISANTYLFHDDGVT